MKTHSAKLTLAAWFAGVMALAGSANAATVEVTADDMRLSDAIALAFADETPAIINIHVNALTASDEQIYIDKPITINGDADGDGIPCDLVVDMEGIRAAEDIGITIDHLGNQVRSYLEVQTAGDVIINDIRIRPDADGRFASHPNVVTAIRTGKPVEASDVGNYTFTNVQVTGADASGVALPLDTDADLFNSTDVRRWGGQSGNEGPHSNHGAIYITDAGAGTSHVILDNCRAGLTHSIALNIAAGGGSTTKVYGGVFGHSARDGIRISGTGVTVKGTAEDRVRVVRTTHVGGAAAHGVEVVNEAQVDLLEYIDIAGNNTANLLAIRGGNTSLVQYVRGLGKFAPESPDTRNHALYFSGSGFANILNCTFHGMGDALRHPLGMGAEYSGAAIVTNSIFTAQAPGFAVHVPTPNPFSLVNCAMPTDTQVGETLGDIAVTGDSPALVLVSPFYESPQYMLTMADYDWSDNQGAGVAGNGPGNANVLRPSNPNYQTAATDNNPLNGGAGAPVANIDPSDWMLMQ